MAKTLTETLDFLMRPSVELNLPQNNYWGVAVGPNNSIVVGSGFLAIHIENIDVSEAAGFNFFSFFENKFTSCTYPISAEEILDKIYSNQFIGKIIFPHTNVINRLDTFSEDQRKRSRVIVSATEKMDNELKLKFSHNGQRYEWRHPAIPKVGYIAANSLIPENFIKPGVTYRCFNIDELETETEFYVNVVEESSKAKIGILYSPNGFIPNNMEAINRMEVVPRDMIVYTNAVEPVENFGMPPVHLRASIFYEALKVLLLTDNPFAEIHFGDNPNKPVMIRSIPQNPADPIITIFQATLNPFFGAQRG